MLKRINNCLISSIILSSLFIIIGLMCIIIPEISLDALAGIITGVFIINGIILISLDFNHKTILINSFLYGILSLVLGIVLVFHLDTLKILLPIGIGIWFLITGLFNLKFVIYLKDESKIHLAITILMSLISIICGFILIFKPLESITVLTMTLGITIVIQAISNIIDVVILKKYMNKFINKYKKYLLEIED